MMKAARVLRRRVSLVISVASVCCAVWLALVPVGSAAAADSAPSGRSIQLPHLDPELPVAPGRNEYLAVCVSCHSPRYVMMQPPFSEAKWEETVDKMVKNYGAQMDSDQRRAIVGYLAGTHGLNSLIDDSAPRDDDFDSAPPSPPPPPSEPPVSLTLAATATERAAQANRGAQLFVQNCAGCHGPSGRGDGFIAEILLRKPKNLAANRFSLRLLNQVLWNGKPGTAMPSWRGLSQADRAALAAYVQSLHGPVEAPPAVADVLQRGNQTFLQNCAPCHGEAGDGRGLAAANLLPEPANFRLKQPDSEYLLGVLRDGIPGTAMPSWQEQLPESDRRALAAFVRSLFETSDSIGR